jgi:multidrug efflux pump subunit AcrA (membrane-fusion protein)
MTHKRSNKNVTRYSWGITITFLLLFYSTAQAAQFKGGLEWVHEVELRVLESGIIQKMKVTVGQTVKKGDVLLQMDQREFKAKLAEAEARLTR